MAELTKDAIAKLFERLYNKMTTDIGRNVAIGIYYIFKASVIAVAVFNGIYVAQFYLP